MAEKHMKEGMRQFENAAEDCSNVADTYLEPLRMDMDHMPDYARLDKPKRPPVPEVRKYNILALETAVIDYDLGVNVDPVSGPRRHVRGERHERRPGRPRGRPRGGRRLGQQRRLRIRLRRQQVTRE